MGSDYREDESDVPVDHYIQRHSQRLDEHDIRITKSEKFRLMAKGGLAVISAILGFISVGGLIALYAL